MEIADKCEQCLNLINDHLLKKTSGNAEIEVSLHKTKGDYYRYLCEFSQGSQQNVAKKSADGSYGEAKRIASNQLEMTHPARLGVVLNYSVFLYEVMGSATQAESMTK